MKTLLKRVMIGNEFINLYKFEFKSKNIVAYDLYYGDKKIFQNAAILTFYDNYAKFKNYDKPIYLSKDEIEKVFIDSLKIFEKYDKYCFDIAYETNHFISFNLFNKKNKNRYFLKKLSSIFCFK